MYKMDIPLRQHSPIPFQMLLARQLLSVVEIDTSGPIVPARDLHVIINVISERYNDFEKCIESKSPTAYGKLSIA